MAQAKDCVLVIAGKSATTAVADNMREVASRLETMYRRPFTMLVLHDPKIGLGVGFDDGFTKLEVNSKSTKQLHKALAPYHSRLMAVTCRSEDYIPVLQRVIPHVPYVSTPTVQSLEWATDKLLMRRRMAEYDKSITPAYTVVTDQSEEAIAKIKRKVGFPLVVKPTGLAASVLVSVCYYEDELREVLKKTFKKLEKTHKKYKGRGEAKIVVEELIEGTQYSIDGYVNERGKVTYVPPVHIKSGRAIGFDDFFGYKQMTPVKLLSNKIRDMEQTATKGVHALGLRNTSIHAELIKTERNGWKLVEIGPRIGGFRHDLYELSYGFNHSFNDVLTRIPRKPIIRRRRKGYTAAMKFFAKTEGVLSGIKGIRKIQELGSFYEITVNKTKGDKLKFAKNGGKSVFNVILHNKSRSDLLADIRRLERKVEIKVVKK